MRIQNRFAAIVLLTAATLMGTESTPESAAQDNSTRITFNKDVLRVLQENCQECHRPGGIAPMSLITYADTRPWAKAIKTAVMKKQMPPWFAESGGAAVTNAIEFRNAPKMTPEDRNTLAAWADSGAREGEASELPASSRQWVAKWSEGWRTQPDVVVSMPASHPVPAKGDGEVRTFFIPSPFKEDTWVTSIEIRPGNPSVVHHAIVQVPRPPAPVQASEKCGDCLLDLPDNEDDLLAYLTQLAQLRGGDGSVTLAVSGFNPDGANRNTANRSGGAYSGGPNALRLSERQTGRGAFTTMDAIYAPGSQPMDFRYTDSAKLIPAGSPIRLEVHYTPNGTPTSDTTMVGFTLAKSPAQRSFVIMAPEHLVDTRKPIPPGVSNSETTGELTFEQDADLVWFMPHMHLRGKDMTYRLIQPDGREQTVLQASFNFNWQLGYELAKPIKVTKGTRMIVTAHHDNSANNRSNPAPDATVAWGEMTNQEMMLPWFGVVVDRDELPETIATYKPGLLN